MKMRCYNPNNGKFKNYGARGITICDRWRNSFEGFISDMGFRPSSKHSLDRIDNNGNYEPGNCRWSTNSNQCRNKRNNRVLTLGEKSQCALSWAEEIGMNYGTLIRRKQLGWTDERALTQPVK